jgi:hypothetical protein
MVRVSCFFWETYGEDFCPLKGVGLVRKVGLFVKKGAKEGGGKF